MEPKIITFPAIDGETGEIVYLEMEESAFLEWEEAIKKEHDELEARRKEAYEIERNAWRYCRDDD